MVNVVGLGYIGWPTALMMAEKGIEVVGTDCDPAVVARLKAQQHDIYVSTTCQQAEFYMIAVPTPYDPLSKKVNPQYVIAAVENVLEVCPQGAIIIIESTLSPGTIEQSVKPVITAKGKQLGKDVNLAHAPERMMPGRTREELTCNNRVIGADEPVVGERVKALYARFCQGEIIVTDIKTAEMTKVAENTYRAVNIAFANELSRICREAEMDVYEVIRLANMHPRVNILQPGPGVGGHCIPVDPWFLVGDHPEQTDLIRTAMETNDSQPAHILHRIQEVMALEGIQDMSRVGLYGLTYKENVDDFRGSPSLKLLQQKQTSAMKSYDPFLEHLSIADNQYQDFEQFLEQVDLVVIMVRHNHIRQHWMQLKEKVILDCWHICPLAGAYYI